MSGEQLCEAAKQGQKEQVTQLIQSGVDVNATDGAGRTALHWSVERTKFAVVKELLDLSARIDVLDAQAESPVHIAVRNCQGPNDTIGKMMVNVLLQRYTGPKRQLVDLQSGSGDTCVHIAVRQANETVLRALVKHRPNLDLPNNANETPRSLAASQSAEIQTLVGRVSPVAAFFRWFWFLGF
jgi:ankyrin repeat protein